MHTSAYAQQDEARCIKLIVLGLASVGKSSLLLRFTDQQWLPEEERTPTIGVDTLVSLFALALLFRVVVPLRFPPSKVHKLDVKGKRVVLNIWVSESPLHACL